ncbi:hypothetical protein RU95_GL000887 [Enterococcus avium]|nr:hypothetical protein RU95_GL000887 [Enterococcus avium]
MDYRPQTKFIWFEGFFCSKGTKHGLRQEYFFRKSKKSTLREVARIEKITESFG